MASSFSDNIHGKIRIFVVDHHAQPEPTYLPVIGVGPNANGTYNDNAGANISEWNPYINEATAIWWIWKHIDEVAPDAELLGICHYRRYWTWFKRCYVLWFPPLLRLAMTPKFSGMRSWQIRLLRRMYKCDGFFTIQPITCSNGFVGSVVDSYRECFMADSPEMIDECLSAFKKRFPELSEQIDSYLTGKKGHQLNMFLVNREEFCRYCEFIFPLIKPFAVRVRNSPFGDKPHSRRAAGYLFELMTGLYWHCRTLQGLRLRRLSTRTFVSDGYRPAE